MPRKAYSLKKSRIVLGCEHKLDSYIHKQNFFVSWAGTVKNQFQACCKDADSITPYGRVGKFDAARARGTDWIVPRRSTHVNGI